MIYIKDLIRKKREKKELTEEELNFFIYSYNRDEILKEQAASLLTLMYTNGLTEKELGYLVKAMSETGEKSELYRISNKIVDIHPVGGMDDKIVIMLIAIINALGYNSAKIIGREIGIKDKLRDVHIYKTNYKNIEELEAKLQKKEIILFEEPENTAPVENKLYKLRNDIACNDDIELIAISLMSQKVAIGVKNIVFDISYGEKAYVKTLNDAKKLLQVLEKIGNTLNVGVRGIITKLEEPLGKYFGSGLELKEALEALKGNMSEDIKSLTLEMGSEIISLITKNNNEKQNKNMIQEIIDNGQAYKKLIELINKDEIQIKPKNVIPVMSQVDGYVERIDMSIIRSNAKYLNAIRHNEEQELDYEAGIELSKKIGDRVEIGEILGCIYTNDDTKIQSAVQYLKDAYVISNTRPKYKGRIDGIL